MQLRRARGRRLTAPARIRGWGAAGAAVAALVLAVATGPSFAEPLFDRYQRWSPRPIAHTRVHIVRIDAASLRALGPWPWPRSYLALLTERLRAGGAAAVGFDLIFAEDDPSSPRRFADAFPGLAAATRADVLRQQPLDEAFGAAVAQVPVVVARVGVAAGGADSAGATAGLDVAATFTARPTGLTHFPLAVGNVAALEFNAAGQGLINGEPDDDGVTRRQLLLATVGDRLTPGFAVDLARVAAGAAGIAPRVASGRLGGIEVAGRHVPVAADGRGHLWFGRLPDGSETSAVDVLRQSRRPRALAGKIVIVGPATVGLGDVRTTPLGVTEFGVRLHAQAVDAILAGGWLDRPAWALAAEWGLGAVLALAAIAGLPRLRGGRAVAVPLAAAGVVAGGSWLAFAAAQVLLDPLRPLLIGGGATLALAAAAGVETRRTARRLREAALARDGEMTAARTIQRAMLPARDGLAGLDPRLDLDAVLEPAQEIGGDLYDAFTLPGDRLVFLVGDVTGKGVSAALFMAVSKTLAHSLLYRGEVALNVVVDRLNAELAIDSVVEVTLLVGVVDLATGTIELVNAGHENPWVVRADGGVAELAMDGGLPLCTMPGSTYPLEAARLGPGDALVLITDGVREAQDAAGNFFGSDRTRAVLAGWGADEPVRAVTARLIGAVRGFEAGTPASDDLTVMALRRRG